jgi:hypothetical protein
VGGVAERLSIGPAARAPQIHPPGRDVRITVAVALNAPD